jgi:2,3-bisphosphoglycerate-dependent phosphoglycerate mutase
MQFPPPPDLLRLRRLDVLLVRHAAPAVLDTAPALPADADHERPLTEEGRLAAEHLAEQLDPFFLSAVYSSPYPRSVQTVQPAAERHALQVQLIDDLRERLLSPTSLPDWREQLQRAWSDFDYAAPGGETGRAAQRRATGVLDLLRVRHPDGGRVLVGSHGNLIALVLHALEPRVDFAFWDAMPMPAVYWLEHDGEQWRAMGGHGFDRFD